MRLSRRAPSVIALVVVVALLTGCSYVNRVAARLNADGSLDFATCDARNADAFDVEWIYPSDSTITPPPPTRTPIVGDVEQGDVFRLNTTTPPDGWLAVSVDSVGHSSGWISGYFDIADLVGGEWVWNQTGIFIGTVDVEHCELDEANAR